MKDRLDKKSGLIYPVATLAGTIIGVGIFSLPYIAHQVGFLFMTAYLAVMAVFMILIHIFFGEVALSTPDFLRLPSYARIHLGKWGERAAFFSQIVGSIAALLAYIVVGGKFLAGLLIPFFGGSELLYNMVYFLLGAAFIFFGIKIISKIEFWGIVLFLFSLILIFGRGLAVFKWANIFLEPASGWNFLLPYGPLLFALSGLSLVPEIEEMLGRRKRAIKKVISASILIPAAVYALFIILIMGISGSFVSKDAISGLSGVLGGNVAAVLFFVGVITTFTSFIAIGLTLKKIFWYDLKISRLGAWAAACFIPLFLFLIGIQDFLKIISFAGGALMAIDGILILLMYRKIKKGRMNLLAYPLFLILIIGIIYEVAYLF